MFLLVFLALINYLAKKVFVLDLDIDVNYQTIHGQYLVINLRGDIDVYY